MTTSPPPGPYFWQVLLLLPSVAALLAYCCHTPSIDVAAETYIFVCFGCAMMQCIWTEAWHHVEGDLGMPRWVHAMAGLTECLVLVLRSTPLGLLFDMNNKTMIAAACSTVALVLTHGLMGGGLCVWCVIVRKPHCAVPALMVLAMTWVAALRKNVLSSASLEASAAVGALVIGFVAVYWIRKLYDHRAPPRKLQ